MSAAGREEVIRRSQAYSLSSLGAAVALRTGDGDRYRTGQGNRVLYS